MGIAFSHLPFYDLCHSLGGIQSPVFALGSLEIHEPPEKILEFAGRNHCVSLAHDSSVRNLFLNRYSVTEYHDCDLNDKAEITLDLAKPLPSGLVSSAMTVWESGTVEHIFDIGCVFRNIHELTCPGGVVIHCAPLTWFEHGYYNFNPRLFSAVAKANGYQLLAEAFHFDQDVLNAGAAAPALYISFDGKEFTALKQRINRLMTCEMTVSNGLYFVAHRKIESSDFVIPYDVS